MTAVNLIKNLLSFLQMILKQLQTEESRPNSWLALQQNHLVNTTRE